MFLRKHESLHPLKRCFACCKGLAALLLELLFPQKAACLCCGSGLGEEETDGLCPACVRALDGLEAMQQGRTVDKPMPGIDYVCSAYPYTAQARQLILRLKFEHVREAAVPLARAMAMLPGGEVDLLVPVPTTKRRERKRGFNQARVLCAHIAQETGMPMADVLIRTQERGPQSRLSGQSRLGNLAGTMHAQRSVAGMRILLIDDVYTTGATAAEAARALRAAGAVGVGVFTAAHSLYDAGKDMEGSLPFSRKN